MSNFALLEATERLIGDLSQLRFAPPVAVVYNPLIYAAASHKMYVERFGGGAKRVLFLGMNPGPWGMAQTGVPFGEITAVRDLMKISAPVSKPDHEHPKRPIVGFVCDKSEVSGRRFWGLFQVTARVRTRFVHRYPQRVLAQPCRGAIDVPPCIGAPEVPPTQTPM